MRSAFDNIGDSGCQYYDVSSFNNASVSIGISFSVIHNNIRSVRPNGDELKAFLDSFKT